MDEQTQTIEAAPEEAAGEPAQAEPGARQEQAEALAETLRESGAEQQLKSEVLDHPLVREAMALLEQTRFKKDLDAVRAVYPGVQAADPREVGEVYCRLMAAGLEDPVVAYEAQLAADRRSNPAPADMAGAKSAGGSAPFFSSRELDGLTEADLKDPHIFRKALASLSKIKN